MLKRLLSCAKEYKKYSIVTPMIVLVECFLDVLIPLLMADIIDNGINVSNMSVVWRFSGYIAISITFSLFFGIVSGYTASKGAAGFAKNLRKEMFGRIQGFSFSNIDNFSSASLVTRLTTDVTNIQQSYQMITRLAIRCPVTLVLAVIMAIRISPKVSLVFALTIPMLMLGLFIMIKLAFPLFEKVFKKYDSLNNVVQEDLRGIREVKSYVREDYQKEQFENVSNDIKKRFVKAQKIIAFQSPIMQFCMYLGILLISWLGAKNIVAGEMTQGQLMAMLNYAMQVLMSLMMFSMVLVLVTMSQASAKRVYEVLQEQSSLTNNENAIKEIKDGEIVMENVSFSYANDASKTCLSSINLHIKAGETIGIIGGTGSSKTSLVQLIPRLYDTTTGIVKIGGVNVKDYDIKALRDKVSMVLQKNILFSGTIKDNLKWGDENATDEEIKHACTLAQAEEFISKMPEGYDTHIEQGGSNVSGGQKQRLCIARALLKKPKVLILDDSTSAVDTKTDALIRKAFKESLPNTTKLIIAQRISSVIDADKIIVMEGGSINGYGSHDELLATNTIYQEVFKSQNGGLQDA